MSEMVERVARTLSVQKFWRESEQDKKDYADTHWQEHVALARAAIAAMRAPTEKMIEVCHPEEDAGPIWRDMIDAALK